MKRNKIKMLLITSLSMSSCFMILFFIKLKNFYLFCSVFCALLGFVFLFTYVLNNNSQRTTIELSSNRLRLLKQLLSFVATCTIMLLALKTPSDYIFVALIIIFIMLVINVSVSLLNLLVINRNGIRNVYHWYEKWENIKSYNLDQDGYLVFQFKDGNEKTVKVDNKSHDIILQKLASFARIDCN